MHSFRTYVKRLHSEDAKEVKSILKTYFETEAMSTYSNLSKSDKNIFVQAYLQVVLPQGVSMGIYDADTNSMCGCSLNSLPGQHLTKDDFQKIANQYQHRLSKAAMQLQEFDDYMESFASGYVGSNNYVINELVIIKPKFQKRKLMEKCVQCAINTARKHHCDAAIGVATSSSSAKVGARHGFQSVRTVYYKDYKDPISGEAIFAGMPPPNDCCVLQIKMMKKQEAKL